MATLELTRAIGRLPDGHARVRSVIWVKLNLGIREADIVSRKILNGNSTTRDLFFVVFAALY